MMISRTLSVSIDCPPAKVYGYVINPENLPEWARGLALSVRQAGREWKVGTVNGPVSLRFAVRNTFGVLDHFITPLRGPELRVPMRVVPNDYGSEVMLTLFRRAGMSEEAFSRDARAVTKDLKNLKEILEKVRVPAPVRAGAGARGGAE